MSISRRKFLKTGTLVAISAGIPATVLASGTSNTRMSIFPSLGSALQSSMDSELFSKYLNTQFTLKNGQTEAKLKLKEVHHWTSRGSKKSADGRECFSLFFENARDERLPQGTYTAVHSSLGEFSLFIVPSGQNHKKHEALFNRLHG